MPSKLCAQTWIWVGGGCEEFYSQEEELRIRIKVSAGATFLCPECIWQQLMMANCDLSGLESACQVVNIFNWVGGLIQQKSSKIIEDQFSSVVQLCPTLYDPMDFSTPGSIGFSKQEYWSRLLFPSPGDLPKPGIEPESPILQTDSYHLSHQGSHICILPFKTPPLRSELLSIWNSS